MKKIPTKVWLLIKEHHARFKVKSLSPGKAIKTLMLWGGLFVGLIFLFVLLFVVPFLPSINNIQNLVAAQSSVILDRHGEVLYAIHGDENRTIIPFEDISSHAVKAVVAIEDERFYEHGGVDFRGVLVAVCGEFRLCDTSRGGSTITQQFVKNAFLSPERTYTRKLKEIILSMQLEGKYTKDQILEMYLNRIPYGSNIFGIEVAAKTLFGKSASDLTLAESAILAAIPKAPTYYSPYGGHRYAQIDMPAEDIIRLDIRSEQDLVSQDPNTIAKGLLGRTYLITEDGIVGLGGEPEKTEAEDGDDEVDAETDEEAEEEEEKNEPAISDPDARQIYVKGRADFVIGQMQALGLITEEEGIAALEEMKTIVFKPYREDIKAPHFVMYVKEILEAKYGKDQIEKGGLRITTTLDWNFQKFAEEAVTERAKHNEEALGVTNAGLVSVNPDTGEVLAMVGSRDYWNDEIDGKVNVTLRQRLPGSSFKPFVYSAAFLKGYAPSTVVYDVQTDFGQGYKPDNFDGQFRGPVTMRQALAASLNIPAIKAAYLAGVPNVLDLARKMGLGLNQPDDWYGLSLALGAGEVRPLDMALAYSVFATGGYKPEEVVILKVEDRGGNILEEYKPTEKVRILDPQVAYLINDVLSDVASRPTEFWKNQLSIPGHVAAAKTGTSNKKKDNVNYPFDLWTMGYTRHLATAVWAGNADGSHVSLKADGLGVASYIWKQFMTEATKDMPKVPFEKPEGIKWVQVDKRSGKLPSEHTPEEDIVSAAFASFSVPTEYDSSYQLVEIDKVSGKLATEYTPDAAREKKGFFTHHSILPDKPSWENAVREWAEKNKEDETPPTEYDDVHTAETLKIKPEITVLSPTPNAIVAPPSLGVTVKVEALGGVREVQYYLNDELVHTSTVSPFSGRIPLDEGLKKGSVHTVTVMALDGLYRSGSTSIQVEIGDDESEPVVSFRYPENGAQLIAGTSLPIEVNAHDPTGDIAKIQFYVDDDLKKTLTSTPYIWQFTVPTTLGEHRLRALAFDHAGNSSSADMDITATSPDNISISGDSRLMEPRSGDSFDQSERILIKTFLSYEDRSQMKEFTVLAKPEKGLPLEVSKIEVEDNSAPTYTFLWIPPATGNYELYLKMTLEDSRIRFSKKIAVEIE